MAWEANEEREGWLDTQLEGEKEGDREEEEAPPVIHWTHPRLSILWRTEAVGSLCSLESFYHSTFLICIPKLHYLLDLSVEAVNPVYKSVTSPEPCL